LHLRRNNFVNELPGLEPIVFHRHMAQIHKVDRMLFKINALRHAIGYSTMLHCRNKYQKSLTASLGTREVDALMIGLDQQRSDGVVYGAMPARLQQQIGRWTRLL